MPKRVKAGRPWLLSLLLAFCSFCIGLGLFAVQALCGTGGETLIPRNEEAVIGARAAAPIRDDAVDLNTAGIGELMELPGIGKALAERIVAYRDENGPFRYPDELVFVRGIGWATFDKLKDRVTVG